jgi:hypothetical protein
VSPLHERIETAVKQRQAVAQAATPGPWQAFGDSVAAPIDQCNCAGGGEWPHEPGCGQEQIVYNTRELDATFIAANGPARIIRDCQRDLKVLERHVASPAFTERPVCLTCRRPGYMMIELLPCPELRDLAEAYGIEATP